MSDDEHTTIVERGIRGRRRWPVGPFRHNLYPAVHPADVRISDLVLERGGNEDVDVLFEPRRPINHIIAQSRGPRPIDSAEFVSDPDTGVRVQASLAAKRIRAAIAAILG
jgi:hypothetical protein